MVSTFHYISLNIGKHFIYFSLHFSCCKKKLAGHERNTCVYAPHSSHCIAQATVSDSGVGVSDKICQIPNLSREYDTVPDSPCTLTATRGLLSGPL